MWKWRRKWRPRTRAATQVIPWSLADATAATKKTQNWKKWPRLVLINLLSSYTRKKGEKNCLPGLWPTKTNDNFWVEGSFSKGVLACVVEVNLWDRCLKTILSECFFSIGNLGKLISMCEPLLPVILVWIQPQREKRMSQQLFSGRANYWLRLSLESFCGWKAALIFHS